MRKYLIAVFFFLWNSFAKGQNLSVLNNLDEKYQKCLDAENKMLLCSQQYYLRIDSLLNVVYRNYRVTLTDKQKQNLKSEQLKWLSYRDNYFKKVENELKSERAGRDAQMIAIDDKAQFVRERVIYFINKLNH
ncbi:lysozyme inhibitor LprI family protein [Adhaeribacter soli]|uniref:DUF1311 domain-containing protein n=1 Tax=Adhaeribacter soli TaxID=2607655 RepID=A0A5N1ITY5_9BACT|nr:lysozyme inhibitor LprI family protein [Adhaeribacter soli]KAA9333554.1 DUF1311 domain-containing protein [Adhaeribacter soli]